MTPANTLVVLNKIDLVKNNNAADFAVPFPSVRTSAVSGAGLDQLKQEIIRVAESIRLDIGDELIAINARHARSLDRAIQALESVGEKLRDCSPIELIASDLREALDCFGEISGRVDNERLLDTLFAKFCIGK